MQNKPKILVIEDNFPLGEKEKITRETDVDLIVSPTYKQGLELIKQSYDHIITDIGLVTGNTDEFLSILEEYRSDTGRSIRAGIENALSGLQLSNDYIDRRIESNVRNLINPSNTYWEYMNKDIGALLKYQGGLKIAYDLHQRGVEFTIYTADILHSYPALAYLVGTEIVSINDFVDVIRQVDQDFYKGENKPYVSSTKRFALHSLVVGSKENPEDWIKLLKILRRE